MKTIVIKTKLKNDTINEVKAWFQTLKARKNEILETMEKEGIFVESAFLDRQGNDTFLIYYIKAENIEYAYSIFNKSLSDIDVYYKENWKLFFEGRIVLEELLDLDRFKNIALNQQ